MKKIVLSAFLALSGFYGFSQSTDFKKPKVAAVYNRHLEGHLIDDNTYEFDKKNRLKVGDSVLTGNPSSVYDFVYIQEKKGLFSLDKLNKLNNLAGDIVPGANKPGHDLQHNDAVYKASDINRNLKGLKDKTNTAHSYTDKAKALINKTLVITDFAEKDFGAGVKEVIATAKLGKKKYTIVVTSALLEHEIYLMD